MGKIDTVTKEYMRDTKVFADLFNYWLYDGRQVIDPEKLHELDTTEIALPFGEDGAVLPVQRFRDGLMSLSAMEDETAAYLVLGAEYESKSNYAMPVKNMLYDALQYSGQISQAAKSVKNARKAEKIRKITDEITEKASDEAAAALAVPKKKPTSDEFLSGWEDDDRLVPVITLVLHLGADEWKGPLNLHAMLSVQNPEILSYIPDYRINLVSPVTMADEEIDKFHTSLREVLLYIKHSKDKKVLAKLLNSDARFRTLERAAAEVINMATNSEIAFEESEENIDMCQAIKEMRQDERESTTLNAIKSVMESFQVTAERAMRSLKVPEEEFEKYLSRM